MTREYDGYLTPYMDYIVAAYENDKTTIEIAKVLYEDFGLRSPYMPRGWTHYGNTPWVALNGVIRNALRIKRKKIKHKMAPMFLEGLSIGG